MYVVVSIVDRELGATISSPTFNGAVERTIIIIERWLVWPEIPDDLNTIRKTLEDNREYLVTDTRNNSEYAVYIGQIE